MKALIKASLNPSINNFLAACGHLVLRVAAGLMIFYVHGWHKLEGWIAYVQHGTPWKLAEEVAEMHFPAPLASAVAATIVQFVCSPSLGCVYGLRVYTSYWNTDHLVRRAGKLAASYNYADQRNMRTAERSSNFDRTAANTDTTQT